MQRGDAFWTRCPECEEMKRSQKLRLCALSDGRGRFWKLCYACRRCRVERWNSLMTVVAENDAQTLFPELWSKLFIPKPLTPEEYWA